MHFMRYDMHPNILVINKIKHKALGGSENIFISRKYISLSKSGKKCCLVGKLNFPPKHLLPAEGNGTNHLPVLRPFTIRKYPKGMILRVNVNIKR